MRVADAQTGQTIRFRRFRNARQRVTVEVESVEISGNTAFIRGRRITRSTANPEWTTTHRRTFFTTDADAICEVIA